MKEDFGEKFFDKELVVACKISDDFVELEPFVQYESFGKVLHNIIVYPKKVLLYARYDSLGNLDFYDVDTDEKVVVRSTMSTLCSYIDNSNVMTNLAFSVKKDPKVISNGVFTVMDDINFIIDKSCNQYSFVTSFNDFYEQKTGKKVSDISLKKAKFVLSILNPIVNTPILLSTDNEVALEQLKEIGLDISLKVQNANKLCRK